MRRRDLLRRAALTLGAAAAPRGFWAVAQRAPLKVGVFVSEFDARGVDERVEPYVSQMRLGLGLARLEINSAGGILGRPVELVFRDDGGSPPSRAAVQRMVVDEGCKAIVSGFVMAAPRLITGHLHALGVSVPVVHGFWTDGSFCGASARHLGPTVEQIIPPVRAHLGDDFEARPFSISTWTPSGRRVSELMYGALGGVHTGDALVTTPVLGSHHGEYGGVMRWADEMESNIIWNADPRPYAVNGVNQAVELGVAEGKVFAYLDFTEWQASQLVPGAEIVTCVPFVASDPDPNVQRFVVRARAMGEGELVTHVAFTHYNALMALRAAMEKSGEASAAGGLAGFQDLALETPTGRLTFDAHGYCTMPMFVASARGGGQLEVMAPTGPIASSVNC